MVKLILTLVICYFSHEVFSQKRSEINFLKSLGRDSLIKLAVKEINNPVFSSENYDKIVVKASKSELVVEFGISVTFIKPKSCFYDFVSISLTGNGNSKSIKGGCDNPAYYICTESDKKKIAFVFDAINTSDEVGHIPNNKISPGSTMIISEELSYYYIEVSNWSTFSNYKINKITGKIYDASHKHYDRRGEKEDEYEIIQ